LPQAGATTLAFSPPDGQLLASGVGDKVMVWSITGQQPPKEPKEVSAGRLRVGSIAFDSGAKRMAFVGNNYYASIFETEGWTEVGCVGTLAALAVAFSPDDHWLLTGGPRLVAWDLATAMRPPRSCGASGIDPIPPSVALVEQRSPYFLSFSSDGGWLAESGGLWSVMPAQAGTGFSVSGKHAFGSSAIVAINPDASLVATRVQNGEFVVWETSRDDKTPVNLGRILLDTKQEGSTVAFGPAGKWVVSAGDRLERWDLAAGVEWARLPHDAAVLAVAGSPNGRYVATTTVDGFAHIWRTSDWTNVLRAEIHRGEANRPTSNIAFSRDNLWLAATSENVLRIFSTDRWREVARKEHEHTITSVTFSPDARRVVTIEDDSNAVNVIAINSWQTMQVVHGTKVDAVSISPDGLWLSTKTDPWCQRARQVPGVVHVWQIADGEPQASMPLVKDSMACQPSRGDKQEGASGKTDLIRASAGWINIPIESSGDLSSPDGRWLAHHEFASDSIQLKALDAPDRPGIPHSAGGVNDMAFSQDGRWLVTTSNDRTARVWALNREDMILESCTRLTHDLSKDDWHRYLGQEPYVPVCPGLPTRQN
jgi:WD40 repeat protein